MPSTAIANRNIDLDDLIDQVANGAFLKDLSAQTGVDKRRLSEALRDHPDYKAAKASAIEMQIDEAQITIRDAKEMTDIARGREMFKAAIWRAEHEARHIWGERIEITGKDGADLIPKQDIGELARKVAFMLRKAEAETVDVISPEV